MVPFKHCYHRVSHAHTCHMTHLVGVFGVNLPEAAGGRLAERAGLCSLRLRQRWWRGRRGSLMARTGR